MLPKLLNLGCGNDVRPGWLNVDGFLQRDDVLRMDMAKTPWPLPSDHFETILMSHVLEHVPFIYERSSEDGPLRDIIFNIMEEVHRVLAPTGRLIILVPYGGTEMAHCHPQHYRQVTPSWAEYFRPDGPESYYSTARFTMTSWKRNPMGIRMAQVMPIRGLGLTSHLKARLPFLRPLLMRRDELEMHWAKA